MRPFEEGVKRGKVESAVRDAAVARITTSAAVTHAIRDADLVIEAVPEDLAMKKELFAVLDQQGKISFCE
jgi:3-hydroxyacyl-CoA dehydrogenase